MLKRLIFIVLAQFVVGHPDENLSITQVIKKYNYPVEIHSFETRDGYLLKIHRIPHGVNSTESKHVALLVHGMAGSAENYIALGPPDSLAYYLADRGYDVWLFNARGTMHSRKHKSLNPNKDRKKFWDFSWHEIAVYDLSAAIDYILTTTKKDSLFYVGHSQGTTCYFVLLSELPEMSQKIKIGVMLAPSAFLKYSHSPLISMGGKLYPLGQRLLEMFNWYELPIPNSPSLNGILKALCKPLSMRDVCMNIIDLIGGTESGLTNKTLLPFFVHFMPQGFSSKQAWHYAQVIATGEFKQYDYGKKKNLRLYNNTKPPKYNFSNVKSPTALFYALQDPYGNPKMVEEFSKVLPNLILKYLVPFDFWNHLDFIIAHNLKEMINDPLYKLFQGYEDN